MFKRLFQVLQFISIKKKKLDILGIWESLEGDSGAYKQGDCVYAVTEVEIRWVNAVMTALFKSQYEMKIQMR